MRWMGLLLVLAASLAFVSMLDIPSGHVSAQAPPLGVYPGDPVSEADKVFISLETSNRITCGVTAADNIRCWGHNRAAPVWAEGFKDVATGRGYSCGLKLDGTLQCWGSSSYGVFTLPTDNGAQIKFKSIDSRNRHVCGIRSDNDRLVCWGYDTFGQASGSPTSQLDIAYDYSNDTFAKISPAKYHTCGLIVRNEGDNSTNIRCWGVNEINTGGLEFVPRIATGIATVPQAYSSTVFKDIAASNDYNCAIIDGGLDDGKAVCWGTDRIDLIGTPRGTTDPLSYVGTPSTDRFTKIAVGQAHVCAIKTDATVKCWGATKASGSEEAFGQADVPSNHQNSTFSDIVASDYHTCAILDGQNNQVEGEVVCWGDELPYDPYKPQTVGNTSRIFAPDHPYPPTHRFPQISSGVYHNCGISVNRDLVCWGGTIESPAMVQGPFKTLDLGLLNTCAIRDNGHIQCWGWNTYMQSAGWSPGLPGSSLSLKVKTIQNLTTDYTFKSVSASFFHTCAILDGQTAGQSEGEVLCWGLKTNEQTSAPQAKTFDSISAGWYHTCGILDDQNGQRPGTAICWGASNNLDEHGNIVRTAYGYDSRADFGQADVPSELSDVAFTSISSSRYQTCAIRADDSKLECWGRSELAQLPDVVTEQKFSAVAAAEYAICAINEDGIVQCWGPDQWSNQVQQFRLPTDYTETRFRDISASLRHACATKFDGTVICWGADADITTRQVEIYSGTTIFNTKQAWVPREFRANTINPPPPIPTPSAGIKILRIEPDIRAIALGAGEQVKLGVKVYGRQDMRDDLIGDMSDITFEWIVQDVRSQDSTANGDFTEIIGPGNTRVPNNAPDDRRTTFTAPNQPGTYRVSAVLDIGTECLHAGQGETEQDAIERCTASFEIKVMRKMRTITPTATPADPAGAIPSLLTDDDGNQYEVFTPVGGGIFIGEDVSVVADPGAVPNGEVIGVRADADGVASNVGQTHHRVTLDGMYYRIAGVDGFGVRLKGYALDDPIEVCLPVPDRLRRNISSLAVVSERADGTFAMLSSIVRLSDSGVNICGALSSLLARVAVGHVGSPSGLPSPTPLPTPEAPDTGGNNPFSTASLLLILALSISFCLMSWVLVRGRRASFEP